MSTVQEGCLRERNYALSILAHFRRMPTRQMAKLLVTDRMRTIPLIRRGNRPLRNIRKDNNPDFIRKNIMKLNTKKKI